MSENKTNVSEESLNSVIGGTVKEGVVEAITMVITAYKSMGLTKNDLIKATRSSYLEDPNYAAELSDDSSMEDLEKIIAYIDAHWDSAK